MIPKRHNAKMSFCDEYRWFMRKFSLPIYLLSVFLVSPVMVRAQEPTFDGTPKSEWLKMLKEDKNSRRREVAARVLASFGFAESGITEAFKTALNEDTAERVRVQICNLVVMPTTRDEKIRERELLELRKMTVPLSDALQNDKVPEVRAAAAKALGRLGNLSTPMVKVLSNALQDKDVNTRAAAAEALGRIGTAASASAPELKAALADKETIVRQWAAFSLGRIGNEGATATEELGKLLTSDPDPLVRAEAALSIGLLGTEAKAAIPALLEALDQEKEKEITVRIQAAKSLGKMDTAIKSHGSKILQTVAKEPNKDVRIFTLLSFSTALKIESAAFVKELAELLTKEPEGEVRLIIVQELGGLGPAAAEALPELRSATSDVQVAVREAAKLAVKRVTAKPEPKKDPSPEPKTDPLS
jgi:HEAT repeat protein